MSSIFALVRTAPSGWKAGLPRYLGAAALLAVGIDHLEQRSVDHYSAIPTIGTLFLLNFVSATLVAVALACPFGRLRGRLAAVAPVVLGLSGIGIAAGSIVGLLVSETSGLFGFMEFGYRGAIVLSLVLEGATVVLLGAWLLTGSVSREGGDVRGRGPARRRRGWRRARRRTVVRRGWAGPATPGSMPLRRRATAPWRRFRG
jgi:hypothetical protein